MSDKEIDIGISQRVVNAAADLDRHFISMQNRADAILKAFTRLTQIQRIITAEAKLANNYGAVAFTNGQQAKALRAANATAFQGTSQGRALGDSSAEMRLSKAAVKGAKDELLLSQALGLNLKQRIAETSKLNNLADLKNQKLLAEVRYGREVVAGNQQATKGAMDLYHATNARIEALKQEKAVKAAAALEDKKAADRAKYLNDLRLRSAREAGAASDQAYARAQRAQALAEKQAATAARNTPFLIGQRGRDAASERLFGDGGANLLKIQAGLAANYLLLQAARTGITDSIKFAVEFDASLRQLQAVVVITNTGLAGLKQNILDVASTTKYSATELTKVAVVLGQAGLSLAQIKKTMAAVVNLAAASGADPTKANDVVTSVLSVFQLEAGQAEHVANVLTEAVNRSKLDIEKLALGIQYSGNTAADAGVGFEELTAALGAMSNAGIRSGSTLGTGMRQILISLEKPSKAFRATLERLGLTMSDIDVRTNGLSGVMDNLARAGFTAGDAIKSFEVRGAAAYTALSRNLDQMLNLQSAFAGSTAAALATETQMRSLSAQGERLGNILKAKVADGFQPLILLARDAAKALADLFQGFTNAGPALTVLVSGISILTGLSIAKWALGAISGLIGMPAALSAVGVAYQAVSVAVSRASLTMAAGYGPLIATRNLLLGLRAAIIPLLPTLGFLGAAIGIGYLAYRSFTQESDLLNTATEKAKARFEESTGAVDDYTAKIETVSVKLNELNNRTEILTKDKRLLAAEVAGVKSQFAEMGLDVTSVDGTLANLITTIGVLKDELAQKFTISLGLQADDLQALQGLTEQKKIAGTTELKSITAGYSPTPGLKLARNLPDSPNADQLRQVDIVMTKDEAALLKKITENGGPSGVFGDTVEEQMLRATEAQHQRVTDLLALATAQEAMALDLEKNFRRQDTNRSQNTPEYKALVDRTLTLQREVDAGVAKIQDSNVGDSVGIFNGITQLANKEQATSKAILEAADQLLKTGVINQDAYNALQDGLSQVDLNTAKAKDSASGDSQDLREAKDSILVARANAERAKLVTKLDTASTVKGISTVVDALKKNTRDMRFAAAKLATTKNGGYLSEVDAANLTEANRINDAETAALIKAARDRVLGKQYQQYQSTFGAQVGQEQMKGGYEQYYSSRQAGAAVDDLKTADRAKAAAQERLRYSYEQIAAGATLQRQVEKMLGVQQDELAVKRTAAIFGEDSLVTAAARVALGRKQYETELATQGITGNMAAKLLANYDSMNSVVGATNRWASAMRAVAGIVNSIGGALRSFGATGIASASAAAEMAVLKAGGTDAAAHTAGENARIDLETKAANVGANPVMRFFNNAKAKTEKYALQQQADLAAAYAASNAGGGGGGGGSGRDSATDRMIADLTARRSASDLTGNAPDGAALAEVVAIGKAELQNMETQIHTLEGQDLTVAKQKELNELVQNHGKLLKFVEETQRTINIYTDENGRLHFNVGATIADYVKNSLDMADVLKSGVGSVLGDLTSGFGDLFTSLAEGTKSGAQAFRDFAVNIIKSMEKVVAQMLAVYAVKKLLGWVGGMIGGDTGTAFTDMAAGLSLGGEVKRMAGGGPVAGSLARDSVPAMLMPGEFVLRASAAQAIGVDNLRQVNAMGNNRRSGSGVQGIAAMGGRPSKVDQNMNVYLVDERSQATGLGPNDVIAIINDDMSRGGSTKKLIKSIQMGSM